VVLPEEISQKRIRTVEELSTDSAQKVIVTNKVRDASLREKGHGVLAGRSQIPDYSYRVTEKFNRLLDKRFQVLLRLGFDLTCTKHPASESVHADKQPPLPVLAGSVYVQRVTMFLHYGF